MRLRMRALSLLVLLGACGVPPASTGTAQDEQAIRDLEDHWATAWNTGDVAGIGALLTGEYETVDARGVHTRGREAAEEMLRTVIANRPPGMTLTVSTTFVHFIDATHATAGGKWSLAGAPAGQPSRGAWLTALVRQGGGWQMVSGLSADEPPAMPMASDTARSTRDR